ncbi:hypothetical protein [Reyranella sp.]|uniref:hypothetical protein n=1 Tax=Reyranella sp. TaxID=1929291 RepID=UPI003BACF885
MSFRLTRAGFLRTAAALGITAWPQAEAQARGEDLFEVTDSETATIDGRHWDTPIAGGHTVDAVHRSVLLRFPGAADDVALLLRKGRLLTKAELVLQYSGYEIVPEGYTCRDQLGRPLWTADPPTWHVEAMPLRVPWIADPDLGPTFNAAANGRRYWARYGATDPERDRHDGLLTPQELSLTRSEARFDITPLLAGDVLAREAGGRLLALDQCGFLLRKVETYDSRYRQPGDAYEWAMPTGGHGLHFARPRLLLSMRPLAGGRSVAVALPPRPSRRQLTEADGSRPTAVLPSPAEVVERAVRALAGGLQGRTDWQHARIAELHRVGGGRISSWAAVEGEAGYKAYRERLAQLLALPPRYWQGWDIADDLLVWHLFRDLLPAPVQDHMRNYWRAWLQPDLPTSAFVHPQSRDAIDYWRRNRDWRGRASFFRDGYNFAISTQNFNHTAAMGALLGGAMVDGAYPMGDGRHGLENLPLRFWAFHDGSTQEMLDPYYLSITLSGQKMFADFAPEPIDRLMGRILVDRTVEMLVSVHHPRLRRFVSSSGRARLPGILVEQDGIYGVLHTLSRNGVVNYLDQPADAKAHDMPVWGYDFPPGRVAMQSLAAPWAPDWVGGLIDDKPLPAEETSTETVRGNFKPPLWRRAWLGAWHGLASTDIRGRTVDVMAQWVREPRPATRMEDLGTLTVQYVANGPDLTTTQGGVARPAGIPLTFQSRNRAIIFAKPHSSRERLMAAVGDADVSRLATVVGLWNFAGARTWKLYADGKRIDSFPARLKAGQRILLHDGVTYLAILPLPAADLGRDAEIEIAPGVAGTAEPNAAKVAPALTVSLFNFRRDRPVAARRLDLRAATTRTYGGLVLEMGDVEQHGSFEAFARHIDAATLETSWDEDKRQLSVAYRSGGDLMEAGFGTDFGQPGEFDHFPIDPGAQEKAIPWRRLNGDWPYLPPGLERDTGWAQQGTGGRLEKNGAVLVTEPGRKAYLLADPLSGAVVGYNPLPDPQSFTLSASDGMRLVADGKVGLLRVEYRPKERRFEITHQPKPGQDGADMARSFILSGLAAPPDVRLNGRPVAVRTAGQDFQVPST